MNGWFESDGLKLARYLALPAGRALWAGGAAGDPHAERPDRALLALGSDQVARDPSKIA